MSKLDQLQEVLGQLENEERPGAIIHALVEYLVGDPQWLRMSLRPSDEAALLTALKARKLSLKVRDLDREHPVVKAAYTMLHAYLEHDTMVPALYQVHEAHPDVPEDYLICLWAGINAASAGEPK